ncbi:MAG TPA: DMT family transporter [Actinomycetota bacterium]|nr:DMT family transporter [Actinomycetota bacterium]
MARVLSTSEGTHRGAFGPTEWFLFASIGLIWGSSFLLIAIGLNAFEPGLVTWLRVVSGAATLVVLPAARRRIDPADRPRLIALAVLWVVVPFTLFPLAQQHVNSAVAGMLNGGLPVVAAIVGSVMLRRPPKGIHIVGLVLGAAGVATIAISAAGAGSSEAIGVGMLLLAILCYAFAVNIAAPLQQRYGSITVMSSMLVIAAVLTAPFGVASIAGSSFRLPSLLAVLALGAVGTGIAFVAMGNLVGRVGGTRAAFATYLIPVVAMILGALVRDEPIEAIGVVGIAAVIAGAVLASRPDRARSEGGDDLAGEGDRRVEDLAVGGDRAEPEHAVAGEHDHVRVCGHPSDPTGSGHAASGLPWTGSVG